jgi:hypothetical protein
MNHREHRVTLRNATEEKVSNSELRMPDDKIKFSHPDSAAAGPVSPKIGRHKDGAPEWNHENSLNLRQV